MKESKATRWKAEESLVKKIEEQSLAATEQQHQQSADFKLEAIVIPVSDTDRSKSFYSSLGWRLDADFAVSESFRVVQLTPPGSKASIHFGKGLTSAVPGAAQNIYLIVSDIEAARAELVARGVKVSDVFHRAGPGQPPLSGRDPARRSYVSFASFSDPDGNSWLLQEITVRLPDRVNADETSFSSPADLAGALRRAAAAHGEHEKLTGKHDEKLAGLVRRIHSGRAVWLRSPNIAELTDVEFT